MKLKPGVTVSMEAAEEIIGDRLSVSAGEVYPLCFDISFIQTLDKKVRDKFSSEEGHKLISAAALIVDSIASRIIGNIFIRYNHPQLPIRLFTDKNAAIRWLSKYRKTVPVSQD